MDDAISRRDLLKTIAIAGAAGMVPADLLAAGSAEAATPTVAPLVSEHYAPGDIVELYSTSDVFIPPRGRSFMKFSFDFPEPAVAFGDHRFGFLVFTAENTYGMDRARMTARGDADALELTCDGFVWAGGQEK